jgi:tRNA dimethylallyltransferase
VSRQKDLPELSGPAKDFKEAVYDLVARIPRGRVMTYGQIATLCGSPRAARIVGGIAHWGPQDLPWQRVVKQDGSLAEGFPGGVVGHADALAADGIKSDSNLKIDVGKLIWWPSDVIPTEAEETIERSLGYARDDTRKLVVIIGPTASGKSALGMELAKKFNGEIICADSRTVYRYMDIGTAKPTHDEMLLIPHHLVDIKMPNEPFTAAEFKDLASKKVDSISVGGHLPIIVGGTGLYIDSLLYDYQFPTEGDAKLRRELNGLSLEQLQEQLRKADPGVFESIDAKNPRRLMRAIETAHMVRSKAKQIRPNTLVIGLTLNKDIIQSRIEKRLQIMLKNGLLDEVKMIGEKFGWEGEAMTGLAYRVFKDVVLGTKTVEEAIQEDIKQEMSLVKRQITWFKRNKDIHWLDAEDPAQLVSSATDLVQRFIVDQI